MSSIGNTTSVKLVLLGEAAVGKSSLVLRFVSNDFQENKEPTIGAAFLTQKCTVGDRTIKYEIWDTAGQERFASLAPMYYRNAQAALVVYDITGSRSCMSRHPKTSLLRWLATSMTLSQAKTTWRNLCGKSVWRRARRSPRKKDYCFSRHQLNRHIM